VGGMAAMITFITIVLFVLIIIALAVRHIALRGEINRITQDLRKINTGMVRDKLRFSILHKPLESLCQQINQGLEIIDKARIDAKNHEIELRTQITNISHDLRTPLTAILGYISMIKTAPEKSAEYLQSIEGRAFALQGLIEQFYELNVIEDSHTLLALEPVDATAVLTDCLLGYYPLFEEKGIQPKTDLPEQAVIVISNAQAIERIFQNLIHNAIKFATHRIEMTLTTEGVFTISNDTENLSDVDIKHLFDRFYAVDKARTAGNTGLGLYIVKRLAEKTNGEISSVTLENNWFTLKVSFQNNLVQ
jgi:signal transduction histidine kinase